MTTESALDKAIREYRENPTETNHRRLLTLQQSHVTSFQRSQAQDFIRRTK